MVIRLATENPTCDQYGGRRDGRRHVVGDLALGKDAVVDAHRVDLTVEVLAVRKVDRPQGPPARSGGGSVFRRRSEG